MGLKCVILFECSIMNLSTSYLEQYRRCQVRKTLKKVSNLYRIHANTHFLDFETNNFFKTNYCGTKRCCTLYMWYHELTHKLFGAIPKAIPMHRCRNIQKKFLKINKQKLYHSGYALFIPMHSDEHPMQFRCMAMHCDARDENVWQ